jgi:hypothetical protein
MANAAHYSHHVPRELVDEQSQSGMKIAIIRNRRSLVSGGFQRTRRSLSG